MQKKELSRVIGCQETLAVIARDWLQSKLCFVESVTLSSFEDITMRFAFRSIHFVDFRNRLASFPLVFAVFMRVRDTGVWFPSFLWNIFPVDGKIINFLFLTDWDLITCRQALQWSHRTDKRMPVPFIGCKRLDFHRRLVKFPCIWFNAVARVKQQSVPTLLRNPPPCLKFGDEQGGGFLLISENWPKIDHFWTVFPCKIAF